MFCGESRWASSCGYAGSVPHGILSINKPCNYGIVYTAWSGGSDMIFLVPKSKTNTQGGSNGQSKYREYLTQAKRDCPWIITTYSHKSSQLRRIIQKYWSILGQDPKLKGILPTQPNFAYKRGPSLGSILSPSLFTDTDVSGSTHWLTTKGCYRCGGTRCGTCRFMRPTKTFKGRRDPKLYNIQFYGNCGTSNVVYLITCDCGLQYVGKTTRPFRKRLSEHLGCVARRDCSSAVAKHLIECHNSALKEAMWIYRLGTVVPNGLNREWELNCLIDC
ncbi:hypothetical protein XELAEV_18014756mg [Xenopus laevis]|uniref:GIY-YIG domain-containing protein n=1 Tax=Xenopus laevis TaxID=8355 RepID=A0A974HVQ0_XENLA|nr:hypothetical protein XELAEV_18014756mg [Xenopus laevis]